MYPSSRVSFVDVGTVVHPSKGRVKIHNATFLNMANVYPCLFRHYKYRISQSQQKFIIFFNNLRISSCGCICVIFLIV